MDQEIKAKMNSRIRRVMAEKAGPSFEERVAVRAAKLNKETKAIEAVQKSTIDEALARAKARPCESAVRKKEDEPPSFDQLRKEHTQTRRQYEARYARESAERKQRMDTREPLYKLSEVNAAFEMQRQRQKEYKKQLQEEENRRWDHLQELQERVLHRPLLIEDPSGSSSSTAAHGDDSDVNAEKEKDPNWKAKFQAQMTSSIKQTIKDRSGPSFQERVNARAAKLRKETKVLEDSQMNIIDAAIAKAKARPTESPFRPKEEMPPSIEQWGKEHAETRRENETRYAELDAERKRRLDSREPLFRVSEVQAAFEMQEERKKDNQRKLRREEQDRWKMLKSMQHRVVDRPLLVESYERPVHSRSEPELRLIPNHTKPSQMDVITKKCVSQPAFLESAWGKEVASLKERMDQRPKLHEIQYPPKVFDPKPPPQKIKTPLDKRLEDVMSQSWYKRSQWASEVANIQQRQDNRPKLHEISYPPKEH